MAPQDDNRPVSYSCPYCDTRNLETVAAVPFIRGYVLAYQIGSNTFIGCVPCVRKKVLGEAGRSLFLGWFSISAFIVNPFLILYNLLRAPFIGQNYPKVRQKLRELGIPEEQSAVNLTSMCYCLAASMIAADGKIEASEIAVANEIGAKLFADFNPADFETVAADVKGLPAPQDIASLLTEILTEEGKKALFLYLLAIAQADGQVAESEKKLLEEIASHMAFDPSTL